MNNETQKWKLVLVEPIDEMIDAACDIDARAIALDREREKYRKAGLEYKCDGVSAGEILRIQWAAMLASSPAPAAPRDQAQDESESKHQQLFGTSEEQLIATGGTASDAGALAIARELLRETIGPLEVSAAIIEDEDGGQAIESLIGRIKKFTADAARAAIDEARKAGEGTR